MVDNPYTVLGVSENASQDEIKSAYRKKAKECHPDLHPDDPHAQDKMNEVNEAYDILSDPVKFANYKQAKQQAEYSSPYGSYGSYTNPYGSGQNEQYYQQRPGYYNSGFGGNNNVRWTFFGPWGFYQSGGRQNSYGNQSSYNNQDSYSDQNQNAGQNPYGNNGGFRLRMGPIGKLLLFIFVMRFISAILRLFMAMFLR